MNVFSGQYFKLFVSRFYTSDSLGFILDFGSSTCGFNPVVEIMSESQLSKVKLGPNPTRDLLNIYINPSLVPSLISIDLIDQNGKIITKITPGNSSYYSLDLTNVLSGVYFLKTLTTQTGLSYKVIRQ